MSNIEIVFRGDLFKAIYEGKASRCVPIICREDREERAEWSIGLVIEGELLRWYNHHTPLLNVWRGTEILRRLRRIHADENDNNGDLHAAYCAGQRHPHQYDRERYVDPIIARIGRAEYQRIFEKRIPEEIIDLIIRHSKAIREYVPSYYHELEEEIRLGTTPWRDEFARIGIRSADELSTLKRFEPLLASYAKYIECPRVSVAMRCIEYGLLWLVQGGAGKAFTDEMLVAMAIIGENWMERSFFHRRMLQDEEITEGIIDESHRWLSTRVPEPEKEALVKFARAYFPASEFTQ